jgi:hypothetical protein
MFFYFARLHIFAFMINLFRKSLKDAEDANWRLQQDEHYLFAMEESQNWKK